MGIGSSTWKGYLETVTGENIAVALNAVSCVIIFAEKAWGQFDTTRFDILSDHGRGSVTFFDCIPDGFSDY